MKFIRSFFYFLCAAVLLMSCVLLGTSHAYGAELIISEAKVRNDTSGYDEYIEFYNASSSPVSLNNYKIGYINTPLPTSNQAIDYSVIAQGELGPGAHFLLAKNELDPNLPLSKKSPFTSLSDTGGTLQLVDEAGEVVDQLRWTSSAIMAVDGVICVPGATATKTQSVSRGKTSQGGYVITPASWQLDTPTPQSTTLLPLTPDESDQTDPSVTNDLSNTVEISELLPNPAAPQIDEADEFIELHNLSSNPVNLKDYTLQSGSNFSYSYKFPEFVLQPHAYEAFLVTQTHLLLSNTAGNSRLLDPAGKVVSQATAYGSAEAGYAWALVEDIWQWTTGSTPGAPNSVGNSPAESSSIIKSTKTTKSTTKATAKSTKPTAPETKAVRSSKKSAAVPVKATQTKHGVANTATPARIHPLILAGVGIGTVLYGLYEYRQDINQALRRLRSNRKVRRRIGSQA